MQLNRPAEARSELNSCLQRERDFAWLYVLRGFASSQAAVRAVAREDATTQFQAAEVDFGRAETILDQHPDEELRYVLLVDRGLMWFQRRELEKAGADLRAAIQFNDRHFQAYAALAKVEQERGQPDDAFAQYTQAIRLRPAWAPLYRGRADVFLNRDDLDDARRRQVLDDLNQAIEYEKPGSPVLARDQTNRARLLLHDGREPEALAACEAALKNDPTYAEAHLLRLQALLRLKRYDDLLASCKALVEQGKGSFDVFALRALARTSLKDYAGAIEDDTQALALRPDSSPVLTRRGWLYLIEQSPKLALRDFERAIAHDAEERRRLQRPGHGAAPPGRPARRRRRRRGGAPPGRADGAAVLRRRADLRAGLPGRVRRRPPQGPRRRIPGRPLPRPAPCPCWPSPVPGSRPTVATRSGASPGPVRPGPPPAPLPPEPHRTAAPDHPGTRVEQDRPKRHAGPRRNPPMTIDPPAWNPGALASDALGAARRPAVAAATSPRASSGSKTALSSRAHVGQRPRRHRPTDRAGHPHDRTLARGGCRLLPDRPDHPGEPAGAGPCRGETTRLSLLNDQGQVLLQSDGQSAADPDDQIELNVPAGPEYLEVENLGGTGSYSLDDHVDARRRTVSAILSPLSVIAGGTDPVVAGDFTGDGRTDLAVANFGSERRVGAAGQRRRHVPAAR